MASAAHESGRPAAAAKAIRKERAAGKLVFSGGSADFTEVRCDSGQAWGAVPPPRFPPPPPPRRPPPCPRAGILDSPVV